MHILSTKNSQFTDYERSLRPPPANSLKRPSARSSGSLRHFEQPVPVFSAVFISAMAYEAVRIAKAAEKSAGGTSSFPDPLRIAECVARMAETNTALIEMARPATVEDAQEEALQ